MSETRTKVNLADLPYRCPQCHKHDKIRDFSTLSSLKHHLHEQHGYRSKNDDTNGRTSPLTETLHDHLKSLEDKLKQAKRDEERNKHGVNVMKQSHHRGSPFPSTPVHPNIPHKVPVYRPPKTRPSALPGSYQSNYLIRNAPQYLGPHKFAPSVPIVTKPTTDMPQTYDVIKRQNDTQNVSAQIKNAKDNSAKCKVTPRETQADETLSKMLDKTEGDLSVLKLQVESNMHPQEAKNMTHTLNTARSQVENLRKTAEKITGEQQNLIEQLQMQLKNRDDQMKKAKKDLDNLRTDRNKLRRDLDDKEKKTNQTEEELGIMKTFLEEKEGRIALKEKELDELSDFVRSASAHEVQARNKLENFISSILDRAQQAEGEVHSLKAQLSLTPLMQSRNSTPLINQNVPPTFSPLNTTFRPTVHSTPVPPVNNAPLFSSPKPFETGRTTPINTIQALNSPMIRLSPGQVVANLHGSLVDPRSPSQSSAHSVDSVIQRSDATVQRRSAYQASPAWSDIDRTPIQSPVAQRLHVARHAPHIASPLTLNIPNKVGENGRRPEPLVQPVADKSLHSPRSTEHGVSQRLLNEMPVPFRPEATFRPVKSSPMEQEEIIRPVERSRNESFPPDYFSIRRTSDAVTYQEDLDRSTKDQYSSRPRRTEPTVSDASIQTVPIKTVSEMVGTSPPSYNLPQAHPSSLLHPSYQTMVMVPNYQAQPSAQVHVAPVRNLNVPVAETVYQDYQDYRPAHLVDPNTPFIVPSIPDHGFQSPPMYSIAQASVVNAHIPYEELTGFAPPEDDDVHSWVDSQNRMFPPDIPQYVQLQTQPDLSVPSFPGYVLPDREVYTSAQAQRKGKPHGTSDSGIGSNPSSRATVHGPAPNQYYPMATVMEDGSGQRSSLGVDEHGILWDNERSFGSSPLHERRNGTRRTYPSFNPNDEQLISNWNKRMAEALESENRELKERLRSLQKKQKHIKDQRKMAAAQELTSDTENLSQESEHDFLTAEESSDVEQSDLHDNQPTDEFASDEKDHLKMSSKLKRQAERQHLVEKLLRSREQRNQDALFCVFMYLDTKTLSRISEVCKDWREISRHPALWRRLEFTHARMSSQYLKTISGWCTQLQSLSLEGLKGRRKSPKVNGDEYLSSTRGCLEDGFEQLVTASQNTLISLKIIDCGNILTDRCLYLAGCYTRLLQRVVYISDSHPAGPEAIWTLGAGCRDITTLIIPPLFPSQKPRRFENGCVKRIGKCWPNLRVVCIGGIEVNTKGLISLVKSCPRLSVLELDHMCEIGEGDAQALCSVGLKGLEELDFTFTPVTPKAIIYFISACPQLKSVGVHIGISDYFDDTSSTRSRQHFKEIVSKLNRLLKRPSVKDILRIKTDYG